MADAEGLRSVMEQLRNLMPLIPERVEGVAEKGSELRKAAESVVHDYKEVQGQAEALFKEVEAEIAALREEAARHHAELGAAMEQVQNAVESLKALDTARGELLAGVGQAGQAMDAFGQAMNAGIEEAKHVGEQFRDGLHLVHQMADTGHQAMSKGLDTAHEAATKLQQGMKKGSDDLEQLFDAYSGKLKDHELKLLNGVEEYLGHARDLHQEFDGHVDDILKNVVQKGVDDAIDGLKNAISTGLKSVLDGAVDEVSEAIHGMVEAVTGSKRSSEEGRGQLEPLFKQVDAFFQPVKVVIDAVKSVAESFGVDF